MNKVLLNDSAKERPLPVHGNQAVDQLRITQHEMKRSAFAARDRSRLAIVAFTYEMKDGLFRRESIFFIRRCCTFKKKMARPHHRKKHKSHLRQFRQSQEITKTVRSKGKASWVFAFAGAVLGSLVGFFAGGALTWVFGGLVVLGLVGYLWGRRMDAGAVR